MKVFEFKINWERKWFYKNISGIKEYLETIFDLWKKDLEKLNHLLLTWNSFFKDEFVIKNWTKILIEIEAHNLI